MGTRETFAIAKTEFDLSLHRAIQNWTDTAPQPQLGSQFPGRLVRQAGPAGTAPAFCKKFAGNAVDPTDPGSFHLLSS